MNTRHPGALMPRSAALALWLPRIAPPAPPAGDTSAVPAPRLGAVDDEALAQALHAVQGDDEPHTARPAADVGEVALADLLRSWAPRTTQVTALFPAAGDPAGVPAAVSAAAIDAEECVLVTLTAPHEAETWALVPAITFFGSVLEPGHLVVWEAVRVPPWRSTVLAAVGDLREAERELRSGLIQATEALDRLDVARWSDSARSVLAGLTGYRALVDLVPEDLDQRRARVLSESARLRYIVDVATADDGGAVNLWQADQRGAALRHVDHVARRSMAAATAYDRESTDS